MATNQLPLDAGLEVVPFQGKQVFNPGYDYPQVASTSPSFEYSHLPGSDQRSISEVPEKDVSQNGDAKRIGGLRRLPFWLLITAIALVVIGASVGGGVAAASQKKDTTKAALSGDIGNTTSTSPNPSSSGVSTTSMTSSSATTSTAAPTTTTTTKLSDCPGSNLTTYQSNFTTNPISQPGVGLTFTKYCGFNINTDSLSHGRVANFDTCIELCASYNVGTDSRNCTSALFDWDSGRSDGQCWTKSKSNTILVYLAPTSIGETDVAVLN